jgi:hypothetical protein
MVKDNLSIYKAVKAVPLEAQKAIGGGRLKGMTDINPMWRIKTLTDQFGVCGFGWKYEIIEKKLEHGSNDQIAAFVDINLYIKMDGEWSAAIPGTGGSSFVAKENNGLYTSDECFKMALTDAISVACKSLGFGAEVYWSKDRTKHDQYDKSQEQENTENVVAFRITKVQCKTVESMITKTKTNKKKFLDYWEVDTVEDMTQEVFIKAMKALEKKEANMPKEQLEELNI